MRYSLLTCLSLVLLTGSSGCASAVHLYLLPPPPSEAVRSQLGTIGVVSARSIAEAKVETPAKGWASGAWKGAGHGAWAGAKPGVFIADHSSRLEALAAGIAIGLAGAMIGVIPGSIHGALTALATATVEQADATLEVAISNFKAQCTTRDHVIKVAQDQTRYRFVLLAEQVPAALTKEVSYRPLPETGIDTIFEISVPTVSLAAALGANPSIRLSMTVRARLVRAVDSEVLYDSTLEYSGGERLFTQWASDNAQPLREELDIGYKGLVEKTVDELFLLRLPKIKD